MLTTLLLDKNLRLDSQKEKELKLGGKKEKEKKSKDLHLSDFSCVTGTVVLVWR
jgi:hypothetical protein